MDRWQMKVRDYCRPVDALPPPADALNPCRPAQRKPAGDKRHRPGQKAIAGDECQSSCRGLGRREVRARLFDDRVESSRIADSQFAEHLSVQLNSRGNQSRDESIVGQAACPKRSAEASDPERAEMTLLLPTVARGVGVGLAGEFQSLTVLNARSAAESAGALQNAFSLACVNRSNLDAWHSKSFENVGARGTRSFGGLGCTGVRRCFVTGSFRSSRAALVNPFSGRPSPPLLNID